MNLRKAAINLGALAFFSLNVAQGAAIVDNAIRADHYSDMGHSQVESNRAIQSDLGIDMREPLPLTPTKLWYIVGTVGRELQYK